MKHIYDINVGGDATAAMLYWDDDRGLDKLIVVNNKKAYGTFRFTCDGKDICEVQVESYRTFGINVEDWMKHLPIWVHATYHGDQYGKTGYCWSTGTRYA